MLIGVACALLLGEGVVRLAGTGWYWKKGENPLGDARPGDRVILCLGNSHTQGVGLTAGFSFPEQLEALLRAKAPMARFRVINAGLSLRSSTDRVSALPALLERYRPVAVALMLGEPNEWVPQWREEVAGLASYSRLWRLLRLLASSSFRRTYSATVSSRLFPDLPLFDARALAYRWVGVYAARDYRRVLKLNPALSEEALRALRAAAALPAPPHPSRIFFTMLAELELDAGHRDAALSAVERALRVGPARFDYFLQLFWERRGRELAGLPGAANAERELRAREPSRRARAMLDACFDEKQREKSWERVAKLRGADLDLLMTANPWLPLLFHDTKRFLYSHRADAAELFVTRWWEDPFHFKQLPPKILADKLRELAGRPAADAFLADVARAFPGFRSNLSEISPPEFDAWLAADLDRAVSLARAAGAVPLLETYPPHEASLAERRPNPVIRRAAASLGVPLVDHAESLRRLFAGNKDKLSYYRIPEMPWMRDHVNREGNAVLAQDLLEALEREKLVP
jgi:hypothetical protein